MENNRQKKIDALKLYYLGSLVEDPINGTDFDCEILRVMDELKRQFADCPSKNYKMDKELVELGFLEPGTLGVAGCVTIPCFGGKMPDQASPNTPCAIIRSMCDISPRQMMREDKSELKDPGTLEVDCLKCNHIKEEHSILEDDLIYCLVLGNTINTKHLQNNCKHFIERKK